jgi:hypothetical protein
MTNHILDHFEERLSLDGMALAKGKFQNKVDNMQLIPIDVIKNVLNMAPRKRIPAVVKRIVKMLEEDLLYTMSQAPEYFKLRAVLQMNCFPFDIDYATLSEFCSEQESDKQVLKMDDDNLNELPCDF